MRKLILPAMLLCLTSCLKDAQESVQNGDFKVELLFEHDGCKMYRFRDGRTVYWSDCRGKVDYSYQSGGKTKTTHHVETIND